MQKVDSDQPEFISDGPVDGLTADSDHLRHAAIAGAIHATLAHAPRGFVIGVIGQWGGGKTSILKGVIAKRAEDGAKTCELNAWKYDAVSLRREWLMATARSLHYSDEQCEDLGRMLRVTTSHSKSERHLASIKTLGAGLVITAAALALCVFVYWVAGTFLGWKPETSGFAGGVTVGGLLLVIAIDQMRKLSESTLLATEVAVTAESRPTDTDEFLRVWEKEFRGKVEDGLVFLIDDLDRCDASSVTEVFATIRALLMDENCRYVIACDETPLRAHLRKAGYDPDEYLQKVFNARFYVPPPHGGDLLALLRAGAKEAKLTVSDAALEGICYALQSTPRHAKQFINNVVASVRTLASRASEEPRCEYFATTVEGQTQVAKFAALRTSFPDCYAALADNPGRVTELERWARGWGGEDETPAEPSCLCEDCTLCDVEGGCAGTRRDRMWRLLARLMRLTPGTGVGDAHLLTGIKEPYPRGCTETEKEALFQLLWGESGRFADTVARASEPDALRIARRAEQQLRQLRAEGRRATAIEVARELGESWEVIPAECRRCIADQVCLTCEEVGGSLDTHLLLTLRDASQERKDAVILATGAGTELKTLAELGEVADTAASQLLAQKIGEVFREPTAREALSIVAGNGVAQGALRHWRQLAADNLERLQDQKEADQVIESAEADPTAACHTTALALARLYGVLRDLPPSGFFTGVGDSLVALAAGRVDHSGYLATLLEPVVDALHRHRDEATETARSFVEQLLEAIRRQQDAEPNVRELCRAVYSVAEGFGPDLWNNWNGHMAFAGALAWYPSPWVYDLITRVGELPQGHPVVDAMARHLSPMGDIQLEPATFCPVFGRLRPDVASSLLLSIMQRISFDAMGSLLSSLVEAPPALEIDALPALTSLFERIRGEMGANRRDIEDLASTCRALARALLARVPQATLAGSLCDLAEEWLQSLEEGEPVRGLAATSLVAIREQVRAADHGLCKKIAVRAEALVLANAALDAGSQRALASVVGSYRYCVPKGTLKAQKTTVEFLSDDLAIRLLRDKAGIEY